MHTDSASPWVPESFRDRPYARTHFARIVAELRANHPFFCDWLPVDGSVPIMDRVTYLDNIDALLNGHAVTSLTAGSTGIPVCIARNREALRRQSSSALRMMQWIGGRMPSLALVHAAGREDQPDVHSVAMPVESNWG